MVPNRSASYTFFHHETKKKRKGKLELALDWMQRRHARERTSESPARWACAAEKLSQQRVAVSSNVFGSGSVD
jgi:hypothetical protein